MENFETCAMVKNQRVKQREQRILGECWQWKANGQYSKGDNCSFRHNMNRRAKSTQPNPSQRDLLRSRERKMHREPEVAEEGVLVEECLDGPARSTLEELAITHSVKSGTCQNACSTIPRMDADLGKSALMHTVRLMNSLVKGTKRMMTRVQ